MSATPHCSVTESPDDFATLLDCKNLMLLYINEYNLFVERYARQVSGDSRAYKVNSDSDDVGNMISVVRVIYESLANQADKMRQFLRVFQRINRCLSRQVHMPMIEMIHHRLNANDPTLVRIKLTKHRANDDWVTMIAAAARNSTHLKTLAIIGNLDLITCAITSHGFLHLVEFLRTNRVLEHFEFSGEEVRGRDLDSMGDALSENSTLKSLEMRNMRISWQSQKGGKHMSQFIEGLRRNRTLRVLDLSSNYIGRKAMRDLMTEAVKGHPKLVKLTISENHLKGVFEVLGHVLQDNKVLVSLEASQGIIPYYGGDLDLHDASMLRLANALKTNTTLRFLILSLNKITNADAVILAEGFAENTTLMHLDLYANNITDEGGAAIADAIGENHRLEYLNLGNNENMANKTAVALGGTLSRSYNVRFLDVSQLQCDDAAGVVLANGVAKSRSLQELNLNCLSNTAGIQAAGGAAFGRALLLTRTLEKLFLDGQPLGNDGVTGLAEGLAGNDTLKVLSLNHTQMGDEGAIALGAAIRGNTRLRVLNIGENMISREGMHAISEGLKESSIVSLQHMVQIDDDGNLFHNTTDKNAIDECLKTNAANAERNLSLAQLAWLMAEQNFERREIEQEVPEIVIRNMRRWRSRAAKQGEPLMVSNAAMADDDDFASVD